MGGALAAPDQVASFDLLGTRARSLFKGAAVGLFFGLSGVGTFLVGLATSNAPALGPSIAVLTICTPLLLLGILLLVVGIRTARVGPDFLIADPSGLSRTSRELGFRLDWREIAQIDVVATQLIPGHDPTTPGNTRGRRTGEQTTLRIRPIDPAGFAARHPALDVSRCPEPVRRMVAGPFGLVIVMQEPVRTVLADAIRYFAGPRFGGRFDDTAQGQRLRAAPYPPGPPYPPGRINP